MPILQCCQPCNPAFSLLYSLQTNLHHSLRFSPVISLLVSLLVFPARSPALPQLRSLLSSQAFNQATVPARNRACSQTLHRLFNRPLRLVVSPVVCPLSIPPPSLLIRLAGSPLFNRVLAPVGNQAVNLVLNPVVSLLQFPPVNPAVYQPMHQPYSPPAYPASSHRVFPHLNQVRSRALNQIEFPVNRLVYSPAHSLVNNQRVDPAISPALNLRLDLLINQLKHQVLALPLSRQIYLALRQAHSPVHNQRDNHPLIQVLTQANSLWACRALNPLCSLLRSPVANQASVRLHSLLWRPAFSQLDNPVHSPLTNQRALPVINQPCNQACYPQVGPLPPRPRSPQYSPPVSHSFVPPANLLAHQRRCPLW